RVKDRRKFRKWRKPILHPLRSGTVLRFSSQEGDGWNPKRAKPERHQFERAKVKTYQHHTPSLLSSFLDVVKSARPKAALPFGRRQSVREKLQYSTQEIVGASLSCGWSWYRSRKVTRQRINSAEGGAGESHWRQDRIEIARG